MNKESYCQVNLCRFPNDHLTSSHKCGKCSKFGHGVTECGNFQKIDALLQNQHTSYPFYNPKHIALPKEIQCKKAKCERRHTHTTGSHEKEFEIDGTQLHLESIKQHANKLLANKPGHYCIEDAGMGDYEVFKNVNGIIERKMINYEDTKTMKQYVDNYQKIDTF